MERQTDPEECSICISTESGELKTLVCNHTFHSQCINTWLDTKSECPICRTEIVHNGTVTPQTITVEVDTNRLANTGVVGNEELKFLRFISAWNAINIFVTGSVALFVFGCVGLVVRHGMMLACLGTFAGTLTLISLCLDDTTFFYQRTSTFHDYHRLMVDMTVILQMALMIRHRP